MRICSFLPSATAILFSLGLGDSVCGVTFECDYPAGARSKPVVVYSNLAHGLPEIEIDRQVKDSSARGQSLYRVDADKLRAIQPDLIVTQDLCHVCAASPDDLSVVLSTLAPTHTVVTLTPHTIGDVWNDIHTVGKACGRPHEARNLIAELDSKIAGVNRELNDAPRVLCLEWLDPPFVGGHWVPEMVKLAGGIDVLGRVGEPGYEVDWKTIIFSDPDIILAMPCGYHRDEVENELSTIAFPPEWYSLRAVRQGNVFAMDSNSNFSRPGPRIAEGVIEMAELFTRLKREVRMAQNKKGTNVSLAPFPKVS